MGYASDLSWVQDAKTINRDIYFETRFKEQTSIRQSSKDIGPNLIIHLAAESHVDRSIDNPLNFMRVT